MEFDELLELVQDEPVFSTAFLLAGQVKPETVRLQLSRWVKSGKVNQLRRGMYALAPPYQKTRPHPFLVANHLQRSSYVSGSTALSHYGIVPEMLQSIVSVGTGRPEQIENPLGLFIFRHIKRELLFGYQMVEVMPGQSARVAYPEKALLDLIYYQTGSDSKSFIVELRLQNMEVLDADRLIEWAGRFRSPRINRAANWILHWNQHEQEKFTDL